MEAAATVLGFDAQTFPCPARGPRRGIREDPRDARTRSCSILALTFASAPRVAPIAGG
jgi:hypothetical protein